MCLETWTKQTDGATHKVEEEMSQVQVYVEALSVTAERRMLHHLQFINFDAGRTCTKPMLFCNYALLGLQNVSSDLCHEFRRNLTTIEG